MEEVSSLALEEVESQRLLIQVFAFVLSSSLPLSALAMVTFQLPDPLVFFKGCTNYIGPVFCGRRQNAYS